MDCILAKGSMVFYFINCIRSYIAEAYPMQDHDSHYGKFISIHLSINWIIMNDITDLLYPRKKGPGVGKAKKHNLRIDMTPMVDLGFLLITFFIFTSTMTEATSMTVIMPETRGTPMPTKRSGAITLLPGDNEKVYYYEGEFDPQNFKSTSIKGIRNIIVDKKQRTPSDDLFVIIKPSGNSDYRNVVDLLDEMTISLIKRYALVKISDQEETLMK
jgi:biopolymer transport protein ExbD